MDDWKGMIAEALLPAIEGKCPLVTVMCQGVTAEDVVSFLKDDAGATIRGGPRVSDLRITCSAAKESKDLSLHVVLRMIKGVDYDFAVRDGVEVIASPYPSLVRVYSRVEEVPGGILRAALLGFLKGASVKDLAHELDGLVQRGAENGEPSLYDSDDVDDGLSPMGKPPVAKA